MRFIPAVSPVQIQVPLPNTGETPRRLTGTPSGQHKYGPLVKWLRHGPFTAVTWVRVPYGSPFIGNPQTRACQYGGLAQLVRAPASHAGGHWFESSSLHQTKTPSFRTVFLFGAGFPERTTFVSDAPRARQRDRLAELMRSAERAAVQQSPAQMYHKSCHRLDRLRLSEKYMM